MINDFQRFWYFFFSFFTSNFLLFFFFLNIFKCVHVVNESNASFLSSVFLWIVRANKKSRRKMNFLLLWIGLLVLIVLSRFTSINLKIQFCNSFLLKSVLFGKRLSLKNHRRSFSCNNFLKALLESNRCDKKEKESKSRVTEKKEE